MGSYETKPMPVRHEIKSQLAKLLATEDLVVEHKKVETACFNVHTRVLTLPLWEKASNTVYDLLVGHEVGHALFTPDEDWTETCKVPQQFVNVVEDARIEKLMKRKYAGLAKTFFGGYKELNEEDFFQLEGEDISKFNLADKANLYFKVGNFLPMDFTPEEKEIVDLIGVSETFADVLIAAEELYKFCKKEKEQEKVDEMNAQQSQGSATSPTENQSDEGKSDSEEEGEANKPDNNGQLDENQPSNNDNQQSTSSSPDVDEEPEIKTVDNLEDKIRQLASKDGYDNVYVEVPKVNLDTIIGKNSEIHKEITGAFNQQQNSYNECHNTTSVDLFKEADTSFRQFKVSAQKEVNYLVKEFECRKAADSYSRASTARTGVLDTARLHSYKFSEDLFKKVTVLPDGKNHGLIFILDWSGSMANVLLDTCKQLFNLIWFCKKVSIPFEVYAFTNEWRRCGYDYETGKHVAVDRTSHYEKKEGVFCIDEDFALMNILTSKVSGNELEKQLMNIWRLAVYFGDTYHTPYTCPSRMYLSGTPLNESLVALHQILPKFQSENKLQKVQCVILTDGEANVLPYHKEVKRAWEKQPYLGAHGIGSNSFLRDRKLGTTYKLDGAYQGYHKFTDVMLLNLRDKFPFTNFIGIRVLSSRDAYRFISLYHSASDDDYKQYIKIQDDWKKLKSFTITKSGYHAYFGLSSSALSQDAEFEVADDASKAQIKSAFVKSLKTKKLNKKVLGEFISLVA
jgi:hypothetical protein